MYIAGPMRRRTPKTELSRVRQATHITQETLARRAGLSQATIKLLEAGYHGSPKSRAAVARALRSTQRELFPELFA